MSTTRRSEGRLTVRWRHVKRHEVPTQDKMNNDNLYSPDVSTLRSKEVVKEEEAEKSEISETWLVTESLPYAPDWAETLPTDPETAIPSSVALLLRKEKMIKEQRVDGEDAKNEQEEEPKNREVLIRVWKSTSGCLFGKDFNLSMFVWLCLVCNAASIIFMRAWMHVVWLMTIKIYVCM